MIRSVMGKGNMAKLDDKIDQLLEPIAHDNLSGAAELARRSALAFLDLLGDIDLPANAPIQQLRQPLLKFAKCLLHAQPKMATLFNLVNRALLILDAQTSINEAKSAIEKYIYNYLSIVVGGSDNIAQQVAPLITDGSIVLIHSYSSTVNRALLNASRNGRHFEVICTESRPVMEGHKTATLLASSHIPVTYIIDAGIGLALQRASLVLCGADAVTSEGIVNKIGTLLLALAAHNLHRPCYILADSTKFLPSNYKLLTEEMHSTGEVWSAAPASIVVFNRYFETIPLEHFTGVITEHGILKIPEVKLHLTNLGVSSELCAEL